MGARLLAYLPRGNTLDDKSWRRRHRLLEWVLLLHVPGLLGLGMWLDNPPSRVGYVLVAPVVALVIGHLIPQRRLASFFVTGGLVFCSAALVLLTGGSIEAHFHFFIIIGFIALYQDWVPFLWNVTFTVVSHGAGTIWLGDRIFAHPAGQANPWLWSAIHGIGVLAACVGMVIFWRITEDEQAEKESLGRKLMTADAEIGRRRFTSEMLVNLARRNQSMLYRQLDIINQLEEKEQDPDALSHLFTLDHLATRVRRNAESLLVLAGEQPPRTWSAPVPLQDVVRAAIAETEDLDRVVFAVDDRVAVSGHTVADLTHLLAELTENAVRFSPPNTAVTLRGRADPRVDGAYLLTVEDWGVGMPPADLAEANELLERPREVDLAVAQRLGFHVVGRLAARHGIRVSLGNTPGSGVTAVVALPAELFAGSWPGPSPAEPAVAAGHASGRSRRPDGFATAPLPSADRALAADALPRRAPENGRPVRSAGWTTPRPFASATEAGRTDAGWRGWWNPESAAAGTAGAGSNGQVRSEGRRPAVPHPLPSQRRHSEDAPPGSGSAPSQPEPGGRTLRRRIPQAHLAPELRRPADAEDRPAPRQDEAAASALSRYQASRQAAQAIVENHVDRAGDGS
jgi:signal transduction histidine kinase